MEEPMTKLIVTYTFERVVELEVENLDPSTIRQALDNDTDGSELELVFTDVLTEDGIEVAYD